MFVFTWGTPAGQRRSGGFRRGWRRRGSTGAGWAPQTRGGAEGWKRPPATRRSRVNSLGSGGGGGGGAGGEVGCIGMSFFGGSGGGGGLVWGGGGVGGRGLVFFVRKNSERPPLNRNQNNKAEGSMRPFDQYKTRSPVLCL